MAYDVSAAQWGSLTGEPYYFAPQGHVAGISRVGVVVATSADIVALDGKIRALESATDAPGQFAKLDPSLVTDWIAFRGDWAQFFAENSGGAMAIPLIIQNDVSASFNQFVGRYNELLRRITAAGVGIPPEAQPSNPSGGDQSWFDKLSSALGSATSATPYVAGGVIVLLGAVAIFAATHTARSSGGGDRR
jgi:hypothetical protein